MRATFSYAEACLPGAGYDTAGEPRCAGRGPAPPGPPGADRALALEGKGEAPGCVYRASRSGDVPGGFSGEGAECGAKKTALAQRRFVVYAASGLPKAVEIAIGVDRLRFISLTEGKAGFGFVAGVQGFKLHALPGL